ncbi:MAG: hypothetical protein E7588_06355 [Ruminococcaceae bacterium]|nr:hypothetical protein [Oscillospiraceae bacterium]
MNKRYSIKRILVTAFIMLVCVCLFGCYPNKPMYEQENADKITAKGTEMMKTWLEENEPGAAIEECTAYIAWTNYDGNNYLTDYATGKTKHNGESKAFAINTVTGKVYFEPDDKTKNEFNALAKAYFDKALEAIGIIPESTKADYAFECHVMAPVNDGDSITVVPYVYSFDFGLPSDAEDLEAFIHNTDVRLPIFVKKPGITVSDETDLSVYDLEALEAFEKEYGIHIGALTIENSKQFLQKNDLRDETGTSLWEYGVLLETDGGELLGRIREHKEIRNRHTNELTVQDVAAEPIFGKTNLGYSISFNDDLNEYITIRAYEGAEMLEYDYYLVDEDDFSTKNDSYKDEIDTCWRDAGDGCYVLSCKSDNSTLKIYNDDVLVRKQ